MRYDYVTILQRLVIVVYDLVCIPIRDVIVPRCACPPDLRCVQGDTSYFG